LKKEYPFTVTITQSEQKIPDLDSLLDDKNKRQPSPGPMARLRKNLGVGASTLSTPTLPPQHNYGLDKHTPSQLLSDMLSSQSSLLGYGTDEEGNVSTLNNIYYTKSRELSDNETSDDGAKEIYDSDEISSIGSGDNMISDESSYLGSSFQSSDSEEMSQEIDDDNKEYQKTSRDRGRDRKYEQSRDEMMQDMEVKEVEKKINVRGQSKGKGRLRDSSKRK
jgi:hypothetical protein